MCREEVARELKSALSSIKLTERGVYVQASTLGSLEALLEFLRTSKIPVSTYCLRDGIKKYSKQSTVTNYGLSRKKRTILSKATHLRFLWRCRCPWASDQIAFFVQVTVCSLQLWKKFNTDQTYINSLKSYWLMCPIDLMYKMSKRLFFYVDHHQISRLYF